MIASIYPLSPMQEGLVYHTLASPETGAYAVQFEVDLHGALDVEVLREAWRRVADRHPPLRTLFAVERSPEILQVVVKEVKIAVRCDDLRELSENEQGQRVEDYVAQDRRRGFDLKRAPLTRVALFRRGDELHRMVWSVHHAVMDGWSWPLVLNDLFAIYTSLVSGTSGDRLPTAPPYEAYVDWLTAQDKVAAESYWRRHLGGMTAPPAMPWDHRPGERADMADGASIVDFAPAEETTRALATLARQHHLTMNTIVQGAWAILLSRYSADRDVCYGVTQSGRPASLPGVEAMTGCFINTLPFRAEVDGAAELASWLAQLQSDAVEQREHDHVSLLRIQEWSEVPRGQPLFETLFVFENYPVVEHGETTSALRVEPVAGHEATNFALTLVCAEGPLRFKLMYDPAWLDASTVERMAGHFGTLLESIASSPRARLFEQALLSPEESHRLAVGWNEPGPSTVSDRCLHELFEEQVARTPEAEAVAFESERLDYRQLNARANQLAHELRARASGRATWWVCAWSVRPTWWWACWGFSKRAQRTCRWISPTPRIASR